MPLTSPIDPPTRFIVSRTTDALWRVTFDNPPINLIDPTMIVELHNLVMESVKPR
jgi:hypothetical protein